MSWLATCIESKFVAQCSSHMEKHTSGQKLLDMQVSILVRNQVQHCVFNLMCCFIPSMMTMNTHTNAIVQNPKPSIQQTKLLCRCFIILQLPTITKRHTHLTAQFGYGRSIFIEIQPPHHLYLSFLSHLVTPTTYQGELQLCHDRAAHKDIIVVVLVQRIFELV